MTTPRIPLSPRLPAALRVPSIVTWNRLEGRPRSDDLERSLRVEVRDPLWMLARQWQVGELTAMDGGSPVLVRVTSDSEQIAQIVDASGTASTNNLDVPLEARVERELAPMDLRTRLQAGLTWMRMVANHVGDDRYGALFIAAYPFGADASAPQTMRARQWYAAAVHRAADGGALLRDLRAGIAIETVAVAGMRVAEPDKQRVVAAAHEFLAFYEDVMSIPTADEHTWVPERLEYQFGVNTASPRGAATELRATEYHGGHLDWYAFDLARTTAASTPPPSQTRSYMPTPATFAGMPSARWWEVEDERVDFGAINAHPTDLATLLLVEFGLSYSNDWSVLALPVAAGSLCRITSVSVIDVFGIETPVPAAHADGSSWSMYDLSGPDRSSAVFVPAVVATPRESPPIERVDFMRDEMANLVWAVESILPDEVMGGIDAFLPRHVPTTIAATPPSATLRYRLIGTVPEPWIPFVPSHVPGSNREIQLQRGSMLGAEGVPVRPRGELLTPPPIDQPYFVHEEEVGRAGVRLTRRWQRTRSSDGRAFVWLGRQRTVSAGEGASGLRFDEVLDTEESH